MNSISLELVPQHPPDCEKPWTEAERASQKSKSKTGLSSQTHTHTFQKQIHRLLDHYIHRDWKEREVVGVLGFSCGLQGEGSLGIY